MAAPQSLSSPTGPPSLACLIPLPPSAPPPPPPPASTTPRNTTGCVMPCHLGCPRSKVCSQVMKDSVVYPVSPRSPSCPHNCVTHTLKPTSSLWLDQLELPVTPTFSHRLPTGSSTLSAGSRQKPGWGKAPEKTNTPTTQ